MLSDVRWDKKKLIRDLREDWGLDAEEEEEKDGTDTSDVIIFSIKDKMVAISQIPAPVPNHEAEENAANNYLWPRAVEIAKAHKAHLMVAVLGKDADLLERGELFVKVMACCSKQECATGLYTSGTVFEPRFYHVFSKMMEDELPIFNWIWFGLYQTEKGVRGYTYSMDVFGKDEMEVLDVQADPSKVRDFLSSLVSYVLTQDVTLQDEETIGFSQEQRFPIVRSQGVSLPGMTLKIGYGKLED